MSTRKSDRDPAWAVEEQRWRHGVEKVFATHEEVARYCKANG